MRELKLRVDEVKGAVPPGAKALVLNRTIQLVNRLVTASINFAICLDWPRMILGTVP
jgi:hypothetical protein